MKACSAINIIATSLGAIVEFRMSAHFRADERNQFCILVVNGFQPQGELLGRHEHRLEREAVEACVRL